MKRYVIFVLAALVGIVSIAPYLYAYWFIGPNPQETEKLHYFYQDSELRYLSRIREITEGYWPAASPVFHEYKEAGNVQQPFGEGLYAVLSLGQEDWIPFVVLATKFLFPAILFLLLFTLISRLFAEVLWLTERAKALIAVGIAFIISQGIGAYRVGQLINLFTMDYSIPVLSIWTRPVNPIFGALILCSVLILAISGSRNSFSWVRSIGLGFLVGISSAYIFSFVLSVFILLVWGVFHILYREWKRFGELVVVAGITLGINAQYFFTIIFGGESVVSLEKNGLFYTTEPVLNKGIALTAVLFLGVFLLSRHKTTIQAFFAQTWTRFCVAVIIGGGLAYTHQVITGVAVWPSHFIQYTDPLVLVCLSVIVLMTLAIIFNHGRASTRVVPWIETSILYGVPIALGILVMIQIVSVTSVSVWAGMYTDVQRYAPVFTWLRDQPEANDCVVFSVPYTKTQVGHYRFELPDYITAYTSCDSYHSHYVFMALPEERIMHNYIAYLRLHSVSSSTIQQYLVEHEDEWRDLFFADWVEKFSDRDDPWLHAVAQPNQREIFYASTIAEIESAFVSSLETPLEEWLTKYQIDYIVADSRVQMPPLAETFALPRYSNEEITIYEIVVQ